MMDRAELERELEDIPPVALADLKAAALRKESDMRRDLYVLKQRLAGDGIGTDGQPISADKLVQAQANLDEALMVLEVIEKRLNEKGF